MDIVQDVRSGKLRPFEAEMLGHSYWEDCTSNKDAIPAGRAQAAKFRKRIMKALDEIYDSKSEYLDFGKVAHGVCGMQSQYCSRYVDGFDCPNFGQGLRIIGRREDYHFLRVHRDDAAEFARRVNEYRREKGMIA